MYCIAKNEAGFIGRWFESARQADICVVADTGSTDGTVLVARGVGCDVHQITVDPWRFDDARNAALALVPANIDWCIALDADEVLTPGWREHLEAVPDHVTRPRYRYTWNWNPDGTPGLQYEGDKIHRRHGYRWHHPVHEVCTTSGIEVQAPCGLEIHHHADNTKSRSSYLPLLAQAVQERPDDDRNAHYYARELYATGSILEAAAEFRRHLALPTAVWRAERARSMYFLARCEPGERETWLLRAAAEDPSQREPWLDLAQFHYETGRWEECLGAATRCLSIANRQLSYISLAEAWGPTPYDLAAIACYRIGLRDRAVRYGQQALTLAPNDERLQRNMEFYLNTGHPSTFAWPESRFTAATETCPHPERWTSTDDDSTEVEVSEMIAGLVRGLQPSYCIETGSAWGQTAEAIGQALAKNGHGVLHSIEPETDRVAFTRNRVEGLPVEVHEQLSIEFTPTEPVDFVFFDSLFGLRVPEFEYFRQWMHPGTIVVFHDTCAGHGSAAIPSGNDLRTEIEDVLGDEIRFIHLPTPRGVTFGEVLGELGPALQALDGTEGHETVGVHLEDDVDRHARPLADWKVEAPGVVVEGDDPSWAEMLDSMEPVAKHL